MTRFTAASLRLIFDADLRAARALIAAGRPSTALAGLEAVADDARRRRLIEWAAEYAWGAGYEAVASDAWALLVRELVRAGATGEALALCARCAAREPGVARWHLMRGRLLLRSARPGEARAALNAAWQFADGRHKPAIARLITGLPVMRAA